MSSKQIQEFNNIINKRLTRVDTDSQRINILRDWMVVYESKRINEKENEDYKNQAVVKTLEREVKYLENKNVGMVKITNSSIARYQSLVVLLIVLLIVSMFR